MHETKQWESQDYDEKIKMLIYFIPGDQWDSENANLEKIENTLWHHIVDIEKYYNIRSDMFVFQKQNRSQDMFITFKAAITDETVELPNAKFINWKPEVNCFFSINALNRLIQLEIGEYDSSHQIDWSKYHNKIIMLKKVKNSDKKITAITHINRVARYNADRVDIHFYDGFISHVKDGDSKDVD